jgi:hypothetical protein
MHEQPWPPPLLPDWKRRVREADPQRWLLDKLVPADAIVQVTGPPKVVKKTLFTMAAGRVVSTGKSVPGLQLSAGFDGKPAPCLFLEYEGPEWSLVDSWDWLDRYYGWPASEEGHIRWAHQYSSLRLTQVTERAKVERLIREEGIKFVVIDTMVCAADASENDPQAMTAVIRGFSKLKEATQGGAVLYIHHLRKSYGIDDWEEDIDAATRGSSALSGAYDHHLAFRPGFQPGSTYLLTRSKVDKERAFRLRWTFDEEQEKAGFDIQELALYGPPDEGAAALAEDLTDTNSVQTLRQLAKSWDVPRVAAENMVEHLLATGVLHRTARGFKRG